jgi:hypothetical protein
MKMGNLPLKGRMKALPIRGVAQKDEKPLINESSGG